MALRFPAAKKRGKPRQAQLPQDQSCQMLERNPDGKAPRPGSQAPRVRATCAPAAWLHGPLLQAWGGSLSPHDRSCDLSCATATPAPLNLQKREKALDKLQVDKNQMPVASRSVRTDVGPGLIAVMDGVRSANLPWAQGHKPACWGACGSPSKRQPGLGARARQGQALGTWPGVNYQPGPSALALRSRGTLLAIPLPKSAPCSLQTSPRPPSS